MERYEADLVWVKGLLVDVARKLDVLDAKLDAALELQARHDEQIKQLQGHRNWLAGIVAAVVAALARQSVA